MIVPISLDEAMVVQDFGGVEFWKRQEALDPEHHRHSKERYIASNEKGHLLQRAMDLNPYGSDFFAWVDMGYLKDSLLENQRMIRFLPTILTRQHAIFQIGRAHV